MRIWWNGTMLYVCICGIPFVWRLLKPENILTISCSVVGYWWACSRSVPQEFSIIVFWKLWQQKSYNRPKMEVNSENQILHAKKLHTQDMSRNKKNLQPASSPPRYTHQTDQTLQAHFIDELPKTWGLRRPKFVNPESTRQKINVLERGFRCFLISRTSNGFRSTPVLVASSTLAKKQRAGLKFWKRLLGLISTNFNPPKLAVSIWQFSASSFMFAGLIFTAVWGHGTCQPGNGRRP